MCISQTSSEKTYKIFANACFAVIESQISRSEDALDLLQFSALISEIYMKKLSHNSCIWKWKAI